MQIKKIIFIPLLFIIFFSIFTTLDIGMEVKELIQLIQPMFFTLTVIISVFFLKLRKVILIIALFLLLLMVFTYLLSFLAISSWIGSLGFGMFTIVIISYLPELIKKGYIERY